MRHDRFLANFNQYKLIKYVDRKHRRRHVKVEEIAVDSKNNPWQIQRKDFESKHDLIIFRSPIDKNVLRDCSALGLFKKSPVNYFPPNEGGGRDESKWLEQNHPNFILRVKGCLWWLISKFCENQGEHRKFTKVVGHCELLKAFTVVFHTPH